MKVSERNSPLQHIPGIDRLVRSEYRTYSGPILPKRLFFDRRCAKSSDPVPIPPEMCLKADVNSLDLIRTTQIENSLFEDIDRMMSGHRQPKRQNDQRILMMFVETASAILSVGGSNRWRAVTLFLAINAASQWIRGKMVRFP